MSASPRLATPAAPPDVVPARLWRPLGLRLAIFAALWWMLTEGAPGSWAVGAVVIVLATAVSLRLQPAGERRLSAAALPQLLLYFVMKSIQGGVQVAWMALRPRLDLRPALVEVRLRLKDESARIFLANLLNLTPGTLSAGLDGDRLTLHVLDARLPVEPEVREAEARVARLFRLALP